MRHIVCTALAVAALTAGADAQVRAEAPVLRGISVDGDLSDWPGGLQRYPIASDPPAYGGTVDGAADLDANFRVGYDPDTGLLHVAVEARDDELVVSASHSGTDACEIYLHPGSQWHNRGPRKMILVPGPMSYGTGPVGLAAYRRDGDVTTYEWSIPVQELFPEAPGLAPGRELGLDVVVVDKDVDGPSAWVPWGPSVINKDQGLERIGRLRLIDEVAGYHFAWATASAPALAVLAVIALAGLLTWRSVEQGRRLRTVERRLGDLQEITLSLGEDVEKLRDRKSAPDTTDAPAGAGPS